MHPLWMHDGCYSAPMPKIVQVRDVPDEVHAALTEQAVAAGLSLNQFVLREYARIARRGDNAAMLRELAEMPGHRPTRDQIVGGIRRERDQGP